MTKFDAWISTKRKTLRYTHACSLITHITIEIFFFIYSRCIHIRNEMSKQKAQHSLPTWKCWFYDFHFLSLVSLVRCLEKHETTDNVQHNMKWIVRRMEKIFLKFYRSKTKRQHWMRMLSVFICLKIQKKDEKCKYSQWGSFRLALFTFLRYDTEFIISNHTVELRWYFSFTNTRYLFLIVFNDLKSKQSFSSLYLNIYQFIWL